jgi:hypothetical protein
MGKRGEGRYGESFVLLPKPFLPLGRRALPFGFGLGQTTELFRVETVLVFLLLEKLQAIEFDQLLRACRGSTVIEMLTSVMVSSF